MENQIIIFENQNLKLNVNLKDDTVWLTQVQMAELFGKDRTVIVRHIANIYKEEELDKDSTCAFFAQVQNEAGRRVTRQIPYYNLDMIISVGYRVNSKQGIIFRKWATSVLKDYIIKGYAINQKRMEYLERTVKLIDIANRVTTDYEDSDVKGVLKVITEYTKALDLLDDYDHKTIKRVESNFDTKMISYKECKIIIEKLRFNSESTLFALERDTGLKSIINDVYQSFGDEYVYKSVEEKAANFLYFIVKNHVFADGNKRIAATLFIYFLNFYNILYKDGSQIIDNNTLTALTLLVAESNPAEKEIIIELIMNFLN